MLCMSSPSFKTGSGGTTHASACADNTPRYTPAIPSPQVSCHQWPGRSAGS